jgi:hypothetical protein
MHPYQVSDRNGVRHATMLANCLNAQRMPALRQHIFVRSFHLVHAAGLEMQVDIDIEGNAKLSEISIGTGSASAGISSTPIGGKAFAINFGYGTLMCVAESTLDFIDTHGPDRYAAMSRTRSSPSCTRRTSTPPTRAASRSRPT